MSTYVYDGATWLGAYPEPPESPHTTTGPITCPSETLCMLNDIGADVVGRSN